jgi:hypothetical protein
MVMAFQNGRLPDSALSPILNGELRKDAAAAWNTMNVEARANGVTLRPTGSKSSYRTFAEQVELYAMYRAGTGSLAAVPGNSNHGWGLAVDVASQEMRSMIDRIGEKYGWAKKWSDAPSEWWHIKWREGSWTGADPGPAGLGVPPTPLPKGTDFSMLNAVVKKNGAIEVFVEAKDGEVFHTWQTAENAGWAGAEKGKRNAGWYSLGTPGK